MIQIGKWAHKDPKMAMKKKTEEILYFGGAGGSLLKAGGFSWSLNVLWRKREKMVSSVINWLKNPRIDWKLQKKVKDTLS
jgi:hypothetical protein